MPDNELTDIRNIRREIAKECGGDLERILDYYVDAQERLMASGKYKYADRPLRNRAAIQNSQVTANG